MVASSSTHASGAADTLTPPAPAQTPSETREQEATRRVSTGARMHRALLFTGVGGWVFRNVRVAQHACEGEAQRSDIERSRGGARAYAPLLPLLLPQSYR